MFLLLGPGVRRDDTERGSGLAFCVKGNPPNEGLAFYVTGNRDVLPWAATGIRSDQTATGSGEVRYRQYAGPRPRATQFHVGQCFQFKHIDPPSPRFAHALHQRELLRSGQQKRTGAAEIRIDQGLEVVKPVRHVLHLIDDHRWWVPTQKLAGFVFRLCHLA